MTNIVGRMRRGAIAGAFGLSALTPLSAQGRGAVRDTALVARRDSLERALEAIAVVDRKLMIPMRASHGARIDAQNGCS